MLKRLFGARERTPEQRLDSFLDGQLGEMVERTAWNHACPVCAWPWRPTWHYHNEDRYTLWSSCGACLAMGIDILGWTKDTHQPVSELGFLIVEQGIARWMIEQINRMPAYEIGEEPRIEGLPGYRGYGRIADWNRRCPACRALWRDSWWIDGDGRHKRVSACDICHSVMADLILVREPEWFDIEDWIGFRLETLDDDDDGLRIIGDEIRPDDWPGRCPACDAPMQNPADSLATDDAGQVSWCPDCQVWGEFLDSDGDDPATIFVWTTIDPQAFGDVGPAPDHDPAQG